MLDELSVKEAQMVTRKTKTLLIMAMPTGLLKPGSGMFKNIGWAG
jgi:hypothetical protein